MSAEPNPPWPEVDHSLFGPVEIRRLTRVERLAGSWLARNWNAIPHVTHHDEADVTDLEATRRRLAAESDVPVTLLPFLFRAIVTALRKQPKFNASLDAEASELTLKGYFHLGFAVDGPRGLHVPVVRDVDRKGILDLAREIQALAEQARTKGLAMGQMLGGCFTVSSLGSIGGTYFTPIINAPEVAILGVTRIVDRPFPAEGGTAWRRMLPLSLSYDHRVIQGAEAARFCRDVAEALASPDDSTEPSSGGRSR